MDKNVLISLTNKEMKKINGGVILVITAITITYSCWAASFIYNMGKDGKSGISGNK